MASDIFEYPVVHATGNTYGLTCLAAFRHHLIAGCDDGALRLLDTREVRGRTELAAEVVPKFARERRGITAVQVVPEWGCLVAVVDGGVQLSRLGALSRVVATVPAAKGTIRVAASGSRRLLAVATRVVVRVYEFVGPTFTLHAATSLAVATGSGSGSAVAAGAAAISLRQVCEYPLTPILPPELSAVLALGGGGGGGGGGGSGASGERQRRNSAAGALLGALGGGLTGATAAAGSGWGGPTVHGHAFTCITSISWIGKHVCLGVIRRTDVALSADGDISELSLVTDSEEWTGTGVGPAVTSRGSTVPDTGYRLSYIYVDPAFGGRLVREVKAGQAPPLDASGEIATVIPPGPGSASADAASAGGATAAPLQTRAQVAAVSNLLGLVGAASAAGIPLPSAPLTSPTTAASSGVTPWAHLAASHSAQAIVPWGATAVVRQPAPINDVSADAERAGDEAGAGAGGDAKRTAIVTASAGSGAAAAPAGMVADDLVERVAPPSRRISVKRGSALFGGAATPTPPPAPPPPPPRAGAFGAAVAAGSLTIATRRAGAMDGDGMAADDEAKESKDAGGGATSAFARPRVDSDASFGSLGSETEDAVWCANIVVAVEVEGDDDEAEADAVATEVRADPVLSLAATSMGAASMNAGSLATSMRRRSSRWARASGLSTTTFGGIGGLGAPQVGAARAVGFLVEDEGPYSPNASASDHRLHFHGYPLAIYGSPHFPYVVTIEHDGISIYHMRLPQRSQHIPLGGQALGLVVCPLDSTCRLMFSARQRHRISLPIEVASSASVVREVLSTPEHLYLYTATGIMLLRMQPVIMQVAALLSQRPPQFEAALTLCEHFRELSTKLRMLNDHISSGGTTRATDEAIVVSPTAFHALDALGGVSEAKIRLIRAQFGYQLFARGEYAVALSHIAGAREPVTRVLSLFPQLLPDSFRSRDADIPVRMPVMIDALLPVAVKALIPYLLSQRRRLRCDTAHPDLSRDGGGDAESNLTADEMLHAVEGDLPTHTAADVSRSSRDSATATARGGRRSMLAALPGVSAAAATAPSVAAGSALPAIVDADADDDEGGDGGAAGDGDGDDAGASPPSDGSRQRTDSNREGGASTRASRVVSDAGAAPLASVSTPAVLVDTVLLTAYLWLEAYVASAAAAAAAAAAATASSPGSQALGGAAAAAAAGFMSPVATGTPTPLGSTAAAMGAGGAGSWSPFDRGMPTDTLQSQIRRLRAAVVRLLSGHNCVDLVEAEVQLAAFGKSTGLEAIALYQGKGAHSRALHLVLAAVQESLWYIPHPTALAIMPQPPLAGTATAVRGLVISRMLATCHYVVGLPATAGDVAREALAFFLRGAAGSVGIAAAAHALAVATTMTRVMSLDEALALAGSTISACAVIPIAAVDVAVTAGASGTLPPLLHEMRMQLPDGCIGDESLWRLRCGEGFQTATGGRAGGGSGSASAHIVDERSLISASLVPVPPAPPTAPSRQSAGDVTVRVWVPLPLLDVLEAALLEAVLLPKGAKGVAAEAAARPDLQLRLQAALTRLLLRAASAAVGTVHSAVAIATSSTGSTASRAVVRLPAIQLAADRAAGVVGSLRMRLLAALRRCTSVDAAATLASVAGLSGSAGASTGGCNEERVELLRRLGRHEEALRLCVHVMGDRDAAERYCDEVVEASAAAGGSAFSVEAQRVAAVYTALLRVYVAGDSGAAAPRSSTRAPRRIATIDEGADAATHPPAALAAPATPGAPTSESGSAAAGAGAGARLELVLPLLVRNLARVDIPAALALLPDDAPLPDVSELLSSALSMHTDRRHLGRVTHHLALAHAIDVQHRTVVMQEQHTTLTKSTVCAVCGKKVAGGGGFVPFVRAPPGAAVAAGGGSSSGGGDVAVAHLGCVAAQ